MGSHVFLLSLFNFIPAFIYYFVASFIKFDFFISLFFCFLFSFDTIFHFIFFWQSYFFYFNIFAFLLLFTSYIYFILFSVRSSSENIPVFHLISLFLCLFKINLMSFLDLRSLRSFVHSHLLSFLFLVIYILTFISLSFLSKEHADFK